MEVPLKEHIEKVICLKMSKVESELHYLEKETERRLEDLVNSRIKLVTIVALLAVVVSAISLVVNIMK